MRRKSVIKLRENEILAKSVYNEDGRVLLNAGVVLKSSVIDRIENMNIGSVYVDDVISDGVYADEILSDGLKQKGRKAIKENIESYLKSGKAIFDGIIEVAHLIINDIVSNKDAIIDAYEAGNKNDFPAHMVNVCALTTLLSLRLGLNMLKIKDVSIGAILHDIGKIELLKEYKLQLKKIGEIEEEKLPEHSKMGYEMMGKQWSFSSVSKIILLMHHENCDGSGYPLQIKKAEIHESARIVKICNDFDNMVSNSGNKMTQSDIIKVLEDPNIYDQDIVEVFKKIVVPYPSGSGVELISGEKGIVIEQNKEKLYSPVIRVIKDKNGRESTEKKEIDLSKDKNYRIASTWSID